MKKIAALAVLLALGMFSVGCQKTETAPAPKNEPAPAGGAAAPAGEPAAPAGETK